MLSHVLPVLLLSVIFLSLLPPRDSDLAADRAALLVLSSAVGGQTRRWNQSEPTPCSWEGVYCDNTTNRVTALRLPGDGLFGQIPVNSIGSLTQLRNLSLRHNSLSGPLPSDLGLCTELQNLFLNDNNFSGEIPATLFGLNNLARLVLSENNFSGEFSPDFNNLSNLRTLYLENNQLTGSLPDLNSLSELRLFNVSFNRLNGSIPSRFNNFSSDAFLGNSLCGSPLNSCPNDGNSLSGGAIAGIVIGSVVGSVLFLAVLLILCRKHRNGQTQRRVKMSPVPPSPVKPPEYDFRSANPVIVIEPNGLDNGYSSIVSEPARTGNVIKNVGDDGLVFFGNGVEVFSLEELLRASAEVLGKGTFGTTYRAYLDNGGAVVVKRLKYVCVPEKEFREKVEWLAELAHENLVPLRAYYYNKDEKLLIYDSMPMGSLADILHGNRGADRAPLTWEVRSRIALGVARGIEYLHSLGPNFSHDNIKSSNILLTVYYGARVSEFCIAPLVSSTSTPNVNGYRAPEVMDSSRVSQKADVYSFGVLLLELLTGKAPTNALNDGVDLPRWVQSVAKEKWTIDVFDPELLIYQNIEEGMVQLLHLAIYCSSEHPDKRPPMVDVSRRINEICGLRTTRE